MALQTPDSHPRLVAAATDPEMMDGWTTCATTHKVCHVDRAYHQNRADTLRARKPTGSL